MDLSKTKLYRIITDPASTAADIWKCCHDYIHSKKDINLIDKDSRETFLHVLCGHGGCLCPPWGVPAIYLMASCGMNLDARDALGETCLHKACRSDDSFRIVVALLRCGVDPLIKNINGQTAEDVLTSVKPRLWRQTLHWLNKFKPGVYHCTQEIGAEERLEKLLRGWCRTHVTRADGHDVDFASVVTMSDKSRELLRQYSATNEFVISMLAGKTLSLNGFPVTDIDVDTKDHTYEDDNHGSGEVPKPLLAAVWETRLESSVQALLSLGVNTGVLFSRNGERAQSEPLFFHLISKKDRPPEPITHAILMTSDLNARDQAGQTAIFKAIAHEYTEQFISSLFKYGLDISIRDKKGRTARDFAEHLKRSKYLTVIDDYIIQLAKDSEIEQLQHLLIQGYNHIVDVTDHRGINLTGIIKQQHMSPNKEELLEFLEKVPQVQSHISLMFRATDTGGTDELRSLTSARLVRARDKCGRSILHKAVLNKKKEMIKFIVQTYPQILDMQDNLGRTALHYAYLVTEGLSLPNYLIFKGANPDVTDWGGRKAESYNITVCGKDQYFRLQRDMKSFSMDVYLTETNFEQSLLKAVRRSDMSEIETLVLGLSDKGDINRYANVLFECVDTGRDDIAVYLIRHGMRTDIYKQYENCNIRNSACSTYTCDHTLTSLCARAKQLDCSKVLRAIEETINSKDPETKSESDVEDDWFSVEMDGRPIVTGPSTMDQFTLLGLV